MGMAFSWDYFFSLRESIRLCYLQTFPIMKYLFFGISILVVFMSLSCILSFADSPSGADEKGATPVETERESDLPDDPLERKPADGRSISKRNAELLPLPTALTNKVKSAVDAIRKALHSPLMRSSPDIPVVFNESVDKHIRCFTGPKRDSFGQWLVRAKKYEPTIRRILKRNDLPEDLVYVAMIESGFNMKACSRANAMGPWQFMDETGRQYGLRVDYWVDERYDLEKSTVAAARYLKKLFDQFGCWYLVAASYNAGENRVKKAMETGGTKDFWELREYNMLPKETQEYVPQLIAAAVIAKNPEMYGFNNISPTPVHKLTKLTVPGGVPLRDIAKVVSIDPGDLKALNPELLQGITPPNVKGYSIDLPGAHRTRPSNVKKGLVWKRRVVEVVQHRIRAKDTVKAIERRYRIARADLSLVNANGLRMEEGEIIYIPRFSNASNQMGSPRVAGTRLAKKTSPSLSMKPAPKLVASKGVSKGRASHQTEVTAKNRYAAEKRNSAKNPARKMVRLANGKENAEGKP